MPKDLHCSTCRHADVQPLSRRVTSTDVCRVSYCNVMTNFGNLPALHKATSGRPADSSALKNNMPPSIVIPICCFDNVRSVNAVQYHLSSQQTLLNTKGHNLLSIRILWLNCFVVVNVIY